MSITYKKLLKRTGYTLLVLLTLSAAAGYVGMRKFNNSLFKETPNYLVYTSQPKPISFEWANDSVGDYFETKVAIRVPLKIKGIPHNFYFQFDTGAPTTIIYGNTLRSLKLIKKDFSTISKDENLYLDSLNITLGGNEIHASMLELLEGYGDSFDINDTIKAVNLGTLGADFLDKKITLIDFKNQFIRSYDERPKWMNSLGDFNTFEFKGRRIMLPARINDQELELFYDSGSSTFGLITSKNRYDNYTDENQEEIRYNANKFGDPIPICHRSTTRMMEIGNSNLNLKRISYVDMYAKYQRFITPFTRIGGWLGNRPFDQNTLILDTQREEFIIIESQIRE
ncbi:hypothetical protein FEE95_19640 [Maribacter algarum]|uniref:Aspartyl protease n=1 Tax=Maribacter algarum (ex Zhang et al. 2020) TaxID=2578118 RepID=A0A5S3PGN6_9FLAO|nr:hypothetical protein [Maribacter algarum]TMM53282.1 hypothetical protein FEE95_19640 [Maribacter algarum]